MTHIHQMAPTMVLAPIVDNTICLDKSFQRQTLLLCISFSSNAKFSRVQIPYQQLPMTKRANQLINRSTQLLIMFWSHSARGWERPQLPGDPLEPAKTT